MIKVIRTDNMSLVSDIYRHPRIYPHLIDDFSPMRERYEAQYFHHTYHLLAFKNAVLMGVLFFHPLNLTLYQIHICMLPRFWGKNIKHAVFAAEHWMAVNTRCKKVIAFIPEFNKPAIALAKRSGYHEEGICNASMQKDGVLINQIILGKSL